MTQPSPTGCRSLQTKPHHTKPPPRGTRCPRPSLAVPCREGAQPLWDPHTQTGSLLSPAIPRWGAQPRAFLSGAQGKPSQAGHSTQGIISNSSAPSRVWPGWSCSQQELTACPAHGGLHLPWHAAATWWLLPSEPGVTREGNAADKWGRQQPGVGVRWDRAEPGTSTCCQAEEPAPSLPDLGLLCMGKD